MQGKTAKSIRKLTTAGVLAAAIVMLTTLVSVPIPGGLGYINLGDAGVLLAGMLLGGGWGALCAGAASALSDVLLGFSVYAPATFVIKGAVALLAGLLYARAKKGLRFLFFYVSALLVPLGYFAYETILYGSAAAIPNVAFNLIQCVVGAAAAHAMAVVLGKTKVFALESAMLPVCAEILREPKNGADVVLLAGREQADIILKAGDILSVQGTTARVVAVDDPRAFDALYTADKERFQPREKPYVRLDGSPTTAGAVAQAALEAIRRQTEE